jgi:hypothetical protein
MLVFLKQNKEFLSGLDMATFMNRIVECKGEGVVLRQPYVKYEHGRSVSLVKFKVFKIEGASFIIYIYIYFIFIFIECTR